MAMMEWIEICAVFALALVFGGMTFFSALMAPLIFAKLPASTAGPFIREVFPWYYLAMGGAASAALVFLTPGLVIGERWPWFLTAGIVAGFVYARYGLMPRINAARDQAGGASAEFQRLHRQSVIINGAQWLAVVVALFLVVR